MKKTRENKYNIELPQSIIESYARFLVPEIRKYYNSEQARREYKEWLEEQEKKTREQGKPQKTERQGKNLDPPFFVPTLQLHQYGETAAEAIGVRAMSIWWNWL